MQVREGLRRSAKGMRVVPSVPPRRVPATPDGEPSMALRYRDGTSGLGLFIEYVDRHGTASARRIACKYFDPGQRLLQAWCFERGAPRAFHIDGLVSAVCTETGEVIDLPGLIDALQRRGMPADDPRVPRLMAVLVFMARCDGRHHAEVAALESAATSFAVRFDGNDRTVEQAVMLANTLAPDSRDFIGTIRWLRTRPDKRELARFLIREAGQVIDADRRHSAEEAELAIELMAELKEVSAV